MIVLALVPPLWFMVMDKQLKCISLASLLIVKKPRSLMPKIVNHEERRQSISTTVSCFAESGFYGVSVRPIAKANGMTTGMLYHYFPGKPEIFRVTHHNAATTDSRFKQSQDSRQCSVCLDAIRTTRTTISANLLSIAIDFHRVHPDRDISTMLDPYEAIRDALNIKRAKQMLTMILGDLARRLIGAWIWLEP